MLNQIRHTDLVIRRFARANAIVITRIALAIIFVWFGWLKVIDASPATPLVTALHDALIEWVPMGGFMQGFGLFEVGIGLLLLIPRYSRIAIGLLLLHLVMVCAPLFVLPSIIWTSFLIPTLEGQYIIKNVLIIAAAINVISQVKPLQK
jgi:uncharacterized membrane protein YkgB